MERGAIKNRIKKLASMWSTPPAGRFLTIKETLFYSLSGLGVSFLITSVNFVSTYIYIPYFFKIAAIHGYAIVAAGSLASMLLQPIFGRLMDRAGGKLGKYKPFILFVSPAAALFGVMATWLPQFAEESGRVAFAYISCVPALALMPFINNMFYTMPSVITPVAQERSDIMLPAGLIYGFAPTILNIIVPLLRSSFIGREYLVIRVTGIISIAISLVMIMFIMKTKERVYVTETKEKLKVRDAMKLVLKNKPLLILCVALIVGCARDVGNAFFYFVMQFRFGATTAEGLKLSGLIITLASSSSLVGMVTMPLLTRKLNNKTLMIIWLMFGALSYGASAIIGYQNIEIGLTSILVLTPLRFAASISAIHLMVPIMVGEACDYQQWKTGKRLEGYVHIFAYSIPAIVGQGAFILIGLLQSKMGFEPKNYEGVLVLSEAMQLTAARWFNAVGLITAASSLLMALVFLFYPLTGKKHAAIIEEIKSRAELFSAENGDFAVPDSAASENPTIQEESAAEKIAELDTFAPEAALEADAIIKAD